MGRVSGMVVDDEMMSGGGGGMGYAFTPPKIL
jgi:hypothetical protein